jgi:putrescine transport system permease protein
MKRAGSCGRRLSSGARVVLAVPGLWLGALFLLPLLMILRLSLSDAASARPPYGPVLDFESGWAGVSDFLAGLDLENFVTALTDPLYAGAFFTSAWVAGLVTAILLVIGYPMALAMARAPRHWQPLLIALVILPFWTSFLIRVYAWIGILKPDGYLNTVLIWLGIISAPLELLNAMPAVIIGMVYVYLPFMVLPLFASLQRIDPNVVEAAQDLGCPPWKVFWRIILPLSLPGAVAGSLLVFIPALGEVVVPDLLGGSDTLLIGKMIWSEFFTNRDWPLASAIAMLLVLVLIGPMLIWQRRVGRQGGLA